MRSIIKESICICQNEITGLLNSIYYGVKKEEIKGKLEIQRIPIYLAEIHYSNTFHLQVLKCRGLRKKEIYGFH